MSSEDSDDEDSDFLIIYIWDRCIGIHMFRLDNIYEKPVLAPCDVCTAKGEKTFCKTALHSTNNTCVKCINDCTGGYLQMAYTVLRCLQEYLINKGEQSMAKVLAKLNTLAKTNSFPELNISEEQTSDTMKALGDKLVPCKLQRIEGEITVHSFDDISTDVVYHTIHKSHTGTKKCPHVRSGYYRTSKNGRVSWVKSCVIHKDEFSEYASADEI